VSCSQAAGARQQLAGLKQQLQGLQGLQSQLAALQGQVGERDAALAAKEAELAQYRVGGQRVEGERDAERELATKNLQVGHAALHPAPAALLLFALLPPMAVHASHGKVYAAATCISAYVAAAVMAAWAQAGVVAEHKCAAWQLLLSIPQRAPAVCACCLAMPCSA
jgi:hypothetical protein